jgi:1-deoxy-D-xylulose-5-phosphate reductoisomerase
MRKVTILGSTGSIGQNTLEIIGANRERFSVYALSAHHNYDKILIQSLLFKPKYSVVSTKELSDKLQASLNIEGVKTKVLFGPEALISVAEDSEVDIVVAAIVGIAGLASSYAAVRSGKRVLLANKESLVSAGHIFMQAVKDNGAILLPIDSEHNAIFQCLDENKYNKLGLDKIILTASGGPFLNTPLSQLNTVTPHEACNHPNWKMGRKISIDSSTMVNKALEVIEAFWLFDIPPKKIEVLIHPQSIIHSIVKYCDGSHIAQIGSTDMKIPIGHALFFPERHYINVSELDLCSKNLEFRRLDISRYKALSIAFSILHAQDHVKSIIFNTANEIFVEAFLEEKIQYLQIIEYIELVLEKLDFSSAKTIEDVIDIDIRTRDYIKQNFLLK